VSSSGIACRLPGCGHGEQPQGVEVGIRPALMVFSPGTPFPACSLAQDAAEASSHIAVQPGIGGPVAVSVVAVPAPDDGVDAGDNGGQTVPLTPLRPGFDRLAEALLTGPLR